MAKFLKLIRNDKGATAIEYGLIAALIAVAAIGAMQGIGSKLSTTFTNVSAALKVALSRGLIGPAASNAAAVSFCVD